MTNQGQQVSLRDANTHYLKEESERRSKERLTAQQVRKALDTVTGRETAGGARNPRSRSTRGGGK